MKDKIFNNSNDNNIISNDSKSYLGYVNKFVDEYNNTYHRCIVKKLIEAHYSALTEKTESIHKALKFKIGHKFRITKYKNA